MRVTTITTQEGDKLAVAHGGNWWLADSPTAPKSVDELVRGGETARRLAEQAIRNGTPVRGEVVPGLCVPWPSKIVCVGLNYRRHAEEAGVPLTSTPTLFSKFHNSLIAAGRPVRLLANAVQYDYEAELGVVIGRRAFRVSEASAAEYVWGYCNCNDLSARDLQRRTTQFLLGKSLDGFLPVGPELVSADEVGDPQKLRIRAWLNGDLRQDSKTSDMVFSVSELISYISQYIPLDAGDLIATGTPEGVIAGRSDKIWMKPGDVVEVEVENLGRLVTPLVAEAS
jgi:2-keto-4-pentenoate hydratase/2-oxohepta-3-ene-1,7-dioic acid hydratase in catechol pathway